MLNIKEPLLNTYHEKILNCFETNSIPFECEYYPINEKSKDATISYTIYPNSEHPRIGFIGMNKTKKNNFFGVIVKTEKVKYLDKEGFDLDHILEEEPVFVASDCIMAFVCMLAIDKCQDLVFEKELEIEFNKMYLDRKEKSSKSQKKVLKGKKNNKI
jgi:hypothetical protein